MKVNFDKELKKQTEETNSAFGKLQQKLINTLNIENTQASINSVAVQAQNVNVNDFLESADLDPVQVINKQQTNIVKQTRIAGLTSTTAETTQKKALYKSEYYSVIQNSKNEATKKVKKILDSAVSFSELNLNNQKVKKS